MNRRQMMTAAAPAAVVGAMALSPIEMALAEEGRLAQEVDDQHPVIRVDSVEPSDWGFNATMALPSHAERLPFWRAVTDVAWPTDRDDRFWRHYGPFLRSELHHPELDQDPRSLRPYLSSIVYNITQQIQIAAVLWERHQIRLECVVGQRPGRHLIKFIPLMERQHGVPTPPELQKTVRPTRRNRTYRTAPGCSGGPAK